MDKKTIDINTSVKLQDGGFKELIPTKYYKYEI